MWVDPQGVAKLITPLLTLVYNVGNTRQPSDLVLQSTMGNKYAIRMSKHTCERHNADSV